MLTFRTIQPKHHPRLISKPGPQNKAGTTYRLKVTGSTSGGEDKRLLLFDHQTERLIASAGETVL